MTAAGICPQDTQRAAGIQGWALGNRVVADRVAADIQMGIDLEINSTPSVFLNNRRVPDVRAAAMEALIEELLGN